METSRRDFLKMAGSGALLLGMSPTLGACAGLKRSDLETQGPVKGLEPGMTDILFLASLAPSGHNMQPWFVKRINPYEYVIGIDKARLLPAVDPENREVILSIGAFVENFCSAALSLGYDSQVEVIGTSSFDEDLAKITLTKTTPTDFPISRISSRRTVKKGFQQKPLSAGHAKKLTAAWTDHIYYFDQNSEHAQCLADWTAESFRNQTFRDDAQEELANNIRFSRKDALKYRYGLTTEGLEITGIAGWYVRNFMSTEDVMGKSFRNQGIELNATLAKEGAGWIIIMSEGSTVADLIETGRRFERMALMVREMGIALHPMTQILEEKQWRDQYTSLHKSAMKPQFILRVGYLGSYPDPVSIRRPVEWFLRT
jgi:hypothetical protein